MLDLCLLPPPGLVLFFMRVCLADSHCWCTLLSPQRRESHVATSSAGWMWAMGSQGGLRRHPLWWNLKWGGHWKKFPGKEVQIRHAEYDLSVMYIFNFFWGFFFSALNSDVRREKHQILFKYFGWPGAFWLFFFYIWRWCPNYVMELYLAKGICHQFIYTHLLISFDFSFHCRALSFVSAGCLDANLLPENPAAHLASAPGMFSLWGNGAKPPTRTNRSLVIHKKGIRHTFKQHFRHLGSAGLLQGSVLPASHQN